MLRPGRFSVERPGPDVAGFPMAREWADAHTGLMDVVHTRNALVGSALVLALTGCGSTESDTTEPAPGDGSRDSSSSSGQPSVTGEEQITPGGIAAIVLDQLGPDTVREFTTFEPEPGSVSVMVRLSDATPHNFGVTVFSPEQAAVFGESGECPSEPERGSQCRTLDNGTTVTIEEVAEGFSDDNEDGMVVGGRAVTPEDGGALAMYESYDDSPAVSAKDLEDLLTDPRLTWLIDPAVNKAGEDIDVELMD